MKHKENLINDFSGIHGIYGSVSTDNPDLPDSLREGFVLDFRKATFDDCIAQTKQMLTFLREAKKYCKGKQASCYDSDEGATVIIDENE